MYASLSDLISALHAQEPPARIWQQPFDLDPGHYKRLCDLRGAAPTGFDLCRYADDIHYGSSPLQPDLFRYLLPICLTAWRQDLLAHNHSEYGGFVENLWGALAEPALLQDNLSREEYTAVERFMTASILDAMDEEQSLSFSGMGAGPYAIFAALGSFSVVFPTLPSLWNVWWEMGTAGQVCSVLQYLSCLLYSTNDNPIFTPWTPLGGGGPPCLWGLAGFIYDRGWREENVAFLQTILTSDYVADRLRFAAQTLDRVVASTVPHRMVEEFESRKPILESRLAELPALLLAAYVPPMYWSD